jgi:hypothetical protein
MATENLGLGQDLLRLMKVVELDGLHHINYTPVSTR